MYYDLLVKIKNALRARKKTVRLPYSNMDMAIAKVLMEAGYLKGGKKKVIERKNFLELELPPKEGHAIMSDFKIISRPSRRRYVSWRDLKPVKHGYGMGILSTSKGIMTIVEARKNRVGGEYLFEIW